MYFIRKLRPPSFTIEHIIGIISVAAFIILLIFFGFQKAYGIFALIGIFYSVINIILYFKTMNSGYLVLTLLFLCIIFFSSFIFIFGLDDQKQLTMALGILTVFVGLWVVYLLFSKKLKWRTRELLEIAAMPVKDTQDGYTERPLVVGRINYSESEIKSFTMFVRQNLIAIPYEEEDKVVYAIDVPFWELLRFSRDYSADSQVVFHYDGNVTVRITKKEYLQYKDKLSFDQLCDSLGKLFIEYIDLFVKGEGIRIIDRFNTLKLNPFIE